jgi:hypothetical protein
LKKLEITIKPIENIGMGRERVGKKILKKIAVC